MNRATRPRRAAALGVALAMAVMLSGCGSSGGTPDASNGPTTTASGASGQVLPVTENPISNDSTVEALTIDSVLVENNEDPATGNAVDDHLEIALTNTGAHELANFEVYYTFTDPTTDTSESYYFALPDSFTIAPGASRVAHFDNTGAADHFPANKYSLYATSTDALDVTVMVSAEGAAVQTATAHKDAGGAEEAD
jgi:hypothetical protein